MPNYLQLYSLYWCGCFTINRPCYTIEIKWWKKVVRKNTGYLLFPVIAGLVPGNYHAVSGSSDLGSCQWHHAACKMWRDGSGSLSYTVPSSSSACIKQARMDGGEAGVQAILISTVLECGSGLPLNSQCWPMYTCRYVLLSFLQSLHACSPWEHMSVCEWVHEWVSECMNEWVSELVDWWVSQSVSQLVSQAVSQS